MEKNKFEMFINAIGWVVIGFGLLAYFLYYTMSFEGNLQTMFFEFHTYIHTAFVIALTIVVVGMGITSGANRGLVHKDFKEANEKNKVIIQELNSKIKDFRVFVRMLNEQEKINVIEDFLFSKEKNSIDELTKKELKELQRIPILTHNILGFTRPLYIEISKGGEIKYGDSYDIKMESRKARWQKALVGLGTSFITYKMIFEWGNIGHAFVSTLILAAILLINFLFQFSKPYAILTVMLPRVVDNKETLYNSFKEYEKGNIKFDKKIIETVVEPPLENEPEL